MDVVTVRTQPHAITTTWHHIPLDCMDTTVLVPPMFSVSMSCHIASRGFETGGCCGTPSGRSLSSVRKTGEDESNQRDQAMVVVVVGITTSFVIQMKDGHEGPKLLGLVK
ncbi:unnamed protein product [Lota lota]